MKKLVNSVFLLAAALIAVSCCDTQIGQSSFDQLVAQRRSIRAYDGSKTISREQVATLVATAQEAPSWANSQSTRYYAVMSPDKQAALREMIGERNKQNVEGASVLLVSSFVKGQAGFGHGIQVNEIGDGWGAYDNGVSNAYFILKAREMGFDTLIMGMRDSERIRALLEIPESEEIMAVIALGYRAKDPQRPERKSLESVLIYK